MAYIPSLLSHPTGNLISSADSFLENIVFTDAFVTNQRAENFMSALCQHIRRLPTEDVIAEVDHGRTRAWPESEA